MLTNSSNAILASAMFYIVEIAKANYLNVYQYLNFLNELLPYEPGIQRKMSKPLQAISNLTAMWIFIFDDIRN